METKILIDSIMRQTTILIAQICTAGRLGAPLASVADQVFLQLSREMEKQGLPLKVIADAFGLSLQTYRRRVDDIEDSLRKRGKTLLESLIDFLRDNQAVTRRSILQAFHQDEALIGSLLNYLVETGIAYKTGKGSDAVYGLTPTAVHEQVMREHQRTALPPLAWWTIYRYGPLSLSALKERLGAEPDAIARAVEQLACDGRIQRDAMGNLSAAAFSIPLGDSAGWEAAVLDHFQAMAKALGAKLRGRPEAQAQDRIGGATLSFDICEGHPLEGAVCGLLCRIRAEANELRDQVDAHNVQHPIDDDRRMRVIFYFGQNVESDASSAND